MKVITSFLILLSLTFDLLSQDHYTGISFEPDILIEGINADKGFGYGSTIFHEFQLSEILIFRTGLNYSLIKERYAVGCPAIYYFGQYPYCPCYVNLNYSIIGIPIELLLPIHFNDEENPFFLSYFRLGYKGSFGYVNKFENVYDSVKVTNDIQGSVYEDHIKYLPKFTHSCNLEFIFSFRIFNKLRTEFGPVYSYSFIDPKKSISQNMIGVDVGLKYNWHARENQ